MAEVQWNAPEFIPREKHPSWYWMSIIIAVIFIGIAIWQRNFLFGVFVVIAEILILLWGAKEPEELEYHIHDKGITIDGQNAALWHECYKFSITDDPHHENLYSVFIHFDKRLRPTMRMPVPGDRLPHVRNGLVTYLPEERHNHTLLDAIEEFLGF